MKTVQGLRFCLSSKQDRLCIDYTFICSGLKQGLLALVLQVRIDALDRDVGFYVKRDKDVDWVFVDNECYPRPGGLYADNFGVYGDNQVCCQVKDVVSVLAGMVSFVLDPSSLRSPTQNLLS
jgi:hypothetical protein